MERQIFDNDPFQRGHRNWALRPDDERFNMIDPLVTKLEQRKALTRECNDFNLHSLAEHGQVIAQGNEVELLSPSGQRYQFSPWGFRALCKQVGAHTEFLKKLPAENVAADLQVLLTERNLESLERESWTEDKKALLLKKDDDVQVIRHLGSQRYGRILDLDVAYWVRDRLIGDLGFTVPPTWDSKPAGLYAGDEDVFFFLQDETKAIEVRRPDGKMETLKRGVMAWNSEVGKKTFGLCSYLYQMICGNHIVWGAEEIHTLETRHVGNALERATKDIMPEVKKYLESGTSKQTDLLTKAMNTRLAEKPDEAVRVLRTKGFTKETSSDAVTLAATDPNNEGLDPLSVMAIVNGFTATARDITNADARTALETKATGLLQSLAA
jgi:hypothetical protein